MMYTIRLMASQLLTMRFFTIKRSAIHSIIHCFVFLSFFFLLIIYFCYLQTVIVRGNTADIYHSLRVYKFHVKDKTWKAIKRVGLLIQRVIYREDASSLPIPSTPPPHFFKRSVHPIIHCKTILYSKNITLYLPKSVDCAWPGFVTIYRYIHVQNYITRDYKLLFVLIMIFILECVQ